MALPAQGQYNENISAKSIITELSVNHTYKIDHVIIIDSLDIGKQKNITSIQITNSKFLGKVYFRNANINNSANFANTIFGDEADFSNSFLKSPNFQGSIFKGPARFVHTNFSGNIQIDDVYFSKDAIFENASFLEDASFFRTNFRNNAYFMWSKFSDQANFYKTNLAESLDFTNASFHQANFNDVKINGTAIFDGARIEEAWFYKVNFGSDVLFRDARINKSLTITKCQFNGDAIFAGTQFDKPRSLALNCNQFNKIYLRWNNISEALAYDDETYLFLVKNYKNLGLFEDANNCYFQYRTERRRYLEPYYSTLDFALEKTYGYGTKPLSVLYVSALLVAIFSFIFMLISYLSQKGNDSKSKFDYLTIIGWHIKFSYLAFLSGTKLFVDAPDRPKMQGYGDDALAFFFTLERVLGAILFGFFALALARTIIMQDI